MPHRILRPVTAAAALAVLGCGSATTPGGPATPAPGGGDPAPAPAAEAPAARPAASPLPPGASPAVAAPVGPRVEVADVSGGDPGQTRAAILPTAEPIGRCRSGTAGVIRVRIRSDERSTSIKVEDSTSLDSAMRRCVLEALSTVDLDEVRSRSSPSEKSPGFSSLVTVAW